MTDGASPGFVRSAYRHHPKQVMPQTGVTLATARLKWYDIAKAETPVPVAIRRLASTFLDAEARSDRWELDHELGFVLLHRCGTEFYFLIVCTWRGDNELWQTVYAKATDETPDFSLFPRENPHKGTYCVWEMGTVWRETQAWKRFLMSSRDSAAQDAYLRDAEPGEV